MILSTSDIKEKSIKKTILIYILISIICFIFSFIYLKLSFGVNSNYMKYLAFIPLILGTIPYFIISKLHLNYNKVFYNLYNAGVCTFTIGSAVQGILEICGAHSFYTKLYLIAGILLIIISIFSLVIKSNRK